MIYFCKLFEKRTMNKSTFYHLKSKGQKILDESIIRRYIVPNPKFEQIDKIMKRHIVFYHKKEIFC